MNYNTRAGPEICRYQESRSQLNVLWAIPREYGINVRYSQA